MPTALPIPVEYKYEYPACKAQPEKARGERGLELRWCDRIVRQDDWRRCAGKDRMEVEKMGGVKSKLGSECLRGVPDQVVNAAGWG